MGVVNLRPGLMRFYCWTCDFTPQAQVQTHAQIWVRLMHLPQEYQRKKTLFEIASGLGTPLILDDATLNRRFSLFARILIDVVLSEQLFDTVIVEREGHVLSVMVQYEKQPSFCSHCKMLGRDLQSCLKLSSLSHEGPSVSSKKAHFVPQHIRNHSTHNLNGDLVQEVHQQSKLQPKSTADG